MTSKWGRRRVFETAALPVLLLGGCGTIMHGRYQEIQLRSDPPGAQATVGQFSVVTPAAVVLQRGHTHRVQFTLDGYESTEREINRRLSGWAILGCFFGLAPYFVDLGTGGAYELRPELIAVDLEPARGR
jgi:hypothetical protein